MTNVQPPHDRAPPPPANLEVEMALIAAVLIDNRVYRQVEYFLRSEHFADERHGRIYETCGRLIAEGAEASPITVKDYLPELPADYLAKLAAAAVGTYGARAYGLTVLDRWKRRQAVAIAQDIEDEARSLHLDRSAEEGLLGARAKIDALLSDGDTEGSVDFGSALSFAIDQSERAFKHGAPGKPCGIRAIDDAAGGAVDKRLRIWAARPSMGKTTLLLNMALGWARQDHRVAFFSLEMGHGELATMALAAATGLDRTEIEAGHLTRIDYQRLDDERERMTALPLYIDDRSGLTVAHIRAACARLKPDVVLVDHLGMIRAAEPGDIYRGSTERISAISKALKALAKTLDRPVEVACQLNRAVEGRDDKHPQLSDLRQSGEIEEDADVIAFLYRAEYYLRRTEPPSPEEDADEAAKYWAAVNRAMNKAEIAVAKRRGGPAPKTARLWFDGPTARFTDLQEGA